MKSIKQSLKLAGMNNKEASILNWFFENLEGTSRQIEQALRMRQPEVSVITSSFNRRKWLTYAEVKVVGKGRPEKKHRLSESKEAVLGQIADGLAERVADLQEAEHALRAT